MVQKYYKIQFMYENFLGLRLPFSEIPLGSFSPFLSEDANNILSKQIDKKIAQYFEQETTSFKYQPIKHHSFGADLTRKEFYYYMKKSLNKYLKKEIKKMEEIINHHRLKLGGNGWIKQTINKMEIIGINLFEFIRQVEIDYWWQKCEQSACQNRKSLYQFQKDIFSFISHSSQIVRQQIKRAIRNDESPHSIFEVEENLLIQADTNQTLVLLIESSCEEMHIKKKKKNKKNINLKNKEEIIVSNERPWVEPIDEEQKVLKYFLMGLQIKEEERSRCSVDEQWIDRIRPTNYFKQ